MACSKSVGKLTNILRKGSFSDVTFIAKDKSGLPKRIPAHKLVLAMTSEAFAAMFFSSLPEESVVQLEDVAAEAFEILLEYAYSDSFEATVQFNSVEIATATAYAAHKYLLPGLFEHCSKYLTENISIDNCCRIYETGLLFDDANLSKAAFNCVMQNLRTVISSEDFLNLSHSTIINLTVTGPFFVSTEDLFEALLCWANSNKGNQPIRCIFEPLLPLIPFLNMTMQAFVRTVGPSRVLTDEEVVTIALHIDNKTTPNRPLPVWCRKDATVARCTQKSDLYYDVPRDCYDDDRRRYQPWSARFQ